MNIGNCFDDCYNECKLKEDQETTIASVTTANKTSIPPSDWSQSCNDMCQEQVGARDVTCGSETSWLAGACIFIMIRIIIIGLKACSVKLVSIPALCNEQTLRSINFKKERNIKDYGAFLLAASVFDIFSLAANFVFLVFWLPGPALAFLIPMFAFIDLYVIIGESLAAAVMYTRGKEWSSPIKFCACCGCTDWPVDEESRIKFNDERLPKVM